MNPVNINSISELEEVLSGKGILTLWVDWSIGKLNCRKLIKHIKETDYSYKVYIINIDHFPSEKQKELLGVTLHGWGEIFVFEKGKILQSFTSKNSFEDFLKEK